MLNKCVAKTLIWQVIKIDSRNSTNIKKHKPKKIMPRKKQLDNKDAIKQMIVVRKQ